MAKNGKAKPEEASEPAVPQKAGSGNMNGAALGLYLIGFVSAVFAVPTLVLLLMVGLGPTMVSWLVNQHSHRGAHLLTIFAFNLSGVLPFLVQLWPKGKNFAALIELLTDVFVYLAMYGAAAAALLVLLIAPQLAAAYLQIRARDQLRAIERSQTALVAEWGQEVAGDGGQETAERAI